MSAQEQPEHNTPLSQQRWLIDVSKDENIPIYIRRGESVRLSMYHARFGRHMVIPEDYTAKLYYQTSGMEGWWEIPAEIMDRGAEGRVDVVWGPEHDNGDDQYIFYVLITSPNNQVLCRGGGTLNMRYAPGAIPNTIPLPVEVIDFDIINYLNAPWVLPSEMDTAIASLSEVYLGIKATADKALVAYNASHASHASSADHADYADSASNVNGFTVETSVPDNAVFTDTIVDITGKADKTAVAADIAGLSDIYLGINDTADNASYAAAADFATEAGHASSADNAGDAGTVNGFTVEASVPAGAVFTDTIVDISGKADKTYVDGKVKTNVPAGAKFTDTVVDISGKADKSYVDSKVKTDVPANAKFTETTINNNTGAITKADIVALGIPAQDTIVDISDKADKTYVDGKVKTDVPAGAKFTDTLVDISGKADKVLPYTPLTGATVTVSPSNSYTWETTAGANLLTASGFTAGVDASCSMIITMFEGDTITASGLTFVDELEPGVNHCFVRQMPTDEVQLFVSYAKPFTPEQLGRLYNYGDMDIVESPDEWFVFDPGTGTITGFNYVAGRETVVIPWEIGGVAVEAIGEMAFSPDYLGIPVETLIVPKTVLSIGGSAFSYCGALTSVSLPAATSIGDYAFSYCYSLTSVSLPAATSIGDSAFSYCGALTSVSLPAATSIGDSAFSSTYLTSVSLPAATDIRDNAFGSCYSLTSVSLPAATSIGDYAFSDCYSLTSVYFGTAKPPEASNVFYSGRDPINATIYYTTGASAWTGVDTWGGMPTATYTPPAP